jgi:fluoroacetyl-CoA thioesterase
VKDIYNIGDKKYYQHTVDETDVAEFESGVVHPFYATFALGRDAEWSGRLFVLDMLDDDEEGIGTFLTVKHVSPALLGQTVEFVAEITEQNGTKMACSFEAKVGDRLVANGTTGQMILKKSKVQEIEEGAR